MREIVLSKKLTSKETARLLGVSEASIKRWADSGLLPTAKTVGGHRRFRPEDVAVFKHSGLINESTRTAKKELMAETTRTLIESEAPELDDKESLIEETFQSLIDGRAEDLSALLVNLYLHGQTIASIADHFLCTPMSRVGDLWHKGELSVAQEHVATRTVITALHNLHAVIDIPKEKRLSALCCSIEEDFHELPVQLAALIIEAGGVDVFNMGMSTPFSALTEAVARFQPDLVCVASTILFNLDRAAREYTEFHKAARRARASIVLGGAGFSDPGVRKRLPADLHAESFRQLEEFIGTLVANES